MFSGLVCRGTLDSCGNCSGTDCVTTGIVIRKMISSTNITSTSGVVLMVEIASSSAPSPGPMLIAMARTLGRLARASQCASRSTFELRTATEQHCVQVGTEGTHRIHGDLVAANEPVVAHDRWHGNGKTNRRHDQRLADRSGYLVDRSLTCDTDCGKRVIDTPHRAEQPH